MDFRIMHARIVFSLWLGLLIVSATFHSAYAAEPKRLGVAVFKGPGEGATRNVVMKLGRANHYQIVPGDQISKTAKGLGVTLDTNDSFRAVAKELGVSAFVTAEVTTKKATLTVRNGADGSVSAEATWTGPNPKKLAATVNATFWRRLGAAIDRGKSPSGSKKAAIAEEQAVPETGADDKAAAAEPEPAPEKPSKKRTVVAAAEEPAAEEAPRSKSRSKKKASEDSESETTVSAKPEPDEEEDSGRPEALLVSVGPRVLTRSLSYTQDIYRRNSKYTLPGAPELGLAVDFYPAALSQSGFIANLGLTAAVAYMLPVVTSPSPSGVGNYGTYSLSWSVGAKVRLPLGLFATVAYGDQRYQLTPKGGASMLDVPMVDYRFVRIGAGARFRVTPDVSVMANLGYLRCLGLGQIGGVGYFPHGTGAAFEAGAAVGYRINNMLEIQGGGDIRRYGLAFHVTRAEYDANPATTRVAGGAVDQYLMGWVALAVVMGGADGGGGGGRAHHGDDEESEAPAKASKNKDDDSSEESEPADEKPAKKKRKVIEEE